MTLLELPPLPEPQRHFPTSLRSRLPEHGLEAGLDRVRGATSIPAGIRAAWELVRALKQDALERDPRRLVIPLRRAIEDPRDGVAAIAAVHVLARLPGGLADAELQALVSDDVPGLAAHALWAMGWRAPRRDLLTPLAVRVARGGLEGTHAQALLARWAREADLAPVVLDALVEQTLGTMQPAPRRRLVETVGLIPGRGAHDVLVRMALDPGEDPSVRRAAIAAFGERPSERLPSSLAALAARADSLGDAVRGVRTQRLPPQRAALRRSRPDGMRIAQVHLGAVLDATASRAGMGDAGGVATLLSGLGRVLAEQPQVAEVVTIGRGLPDAGGPEALEGHHRFESVPLEDGEGASFAGDWPALVAARRGIRAALLAGHVPDVLHLRMADPGSLAAADIARQLAIPTVFTLAPDPHGPVVALERAGRLDRRGFVAADARDHLWFRMHLVDRLARQARELVLFPRPDLARQLRTLVGVDLASGPPRSTIVPEGVDVRAAEDARRAVHTSGFADGPAVSDLRGAIAAWPPERHGLPLVMSVGRLNESKGMSRVIEAFALDADLAARANLVIVGGDLETPSSTEAAELSRIRRLFDAHPGLEDRVVLLGHRTNGQVGHLLALARHGLDPLIGPAGAYACGSLKEEFGLAIVEAMGAGLPVVAPREGGPPTYVEDGITGALVDTSDPAAIAAGLRATLDLSRQPRSAARARDVVGRRFTLERMARSLVAVYRTTAVHGSLGAQPAPSAATAERQEPAA